MTDSTLCKRPVKPGDHVFLIDGSGYIFRAYHALPPLTRPSDGLPVGAVHGFSQMLWKLLRDSKDLEKPTHLAVIFDAARENFRNEIYPDYKANRPEPPEDLIPQFALIKRAVEAFSVPSLQKEGYEADDLIATYTKQARAAGAYVTIVSSDKDLMQLLGPGVIMYDTMKNTRLSEEDVEKKFGVPPDKVVDVQALAGDSTDNVPGVPGIGIKTAALLINEYGDLDTLLARAGEIKQKKRRENLIKYADLARISRDLVQLKQDVPIDVGLESMAVCDQDPQPLLSFMQEMEFNTLTRRIAEALDAEIPAPSPSGKAAGTKKTKQTADKAPAPAEAIATPASLAERRAAEALAQPINHEHYQILTTLDELEQWIAEAADQGFVAFDTETTSLDAMRADLVGFSMALAPGRACYVPVGHTAAGGGLDLEGTDTIKQLPLQEALDRLAPMLADESVRIIGQNLKYDLLVLSRYGITVNNIEDTMLLSYVLEGGRGGHGMDELSKRHLGHQPIPFKEIAGTGKAKLTFDQVPIDKAARYACEDADITLRLYNVLSPRLIAEHKATVYQTLERPLVPVLVGMEREGILVDRQILSRLSGRFAQRMAALEDEIKQLAGEDFNIASPKQLGEILFGKFGLPGGKKTKTGAWSTGAGVLEELAAEGVELAAKVLQWRQLAKLKSTYTDALPGFINPSTGRIHTSYAMAATTTGRLASTDPNLQNIPVRSQEGREIRTAFIAPEGHKLVSADYSQIELRVLAHIADIASLKQAFAEGLDIHAMTASEMFNVPLDAMTPEIRRRAKAINFGIIYGISAFGLANQLGIERSEAADYIKTYFQRFPGIKRYMEDIKDFVHKHGYVETLFGRRIHYPEINTKSPQRRALFERAAINAPIQGSAADILRRAMVRMPDALAAAGVNAKMLLQVHDELIFEVPDDEAEALIKTVREVMAHACEPALEFSVPLQVDAKAARNWDEAH